MKRNSWHVYLVEWFIKLDSFNRYLLKSRFNNNIINYLEGTGRNNICTYTTTILLALLLISLTIMIGSILGIIFLDPVFAFIGTLFGNPYMYFFNQDTWLIGTLFWFIGGFLGGVYWLTKRTKSILDKNGNTTESEFTKLVKAKYRSFKDKTCIKLDFE